MIISDLNHIEAVEASSVVGGSYYYPYSSKYINVSVYDYKNIDARANIKGNTAVADAVAYGKDTTAQAFTYTDDYSSKATAISATA